MWKCVSAICSPLPKRHSPPARLARSVVRERNAPDNHAHGRVRRDLPVARARRCRTSSLISTSGTSNRVTPVAPTRYCATVFHAIDRSQPKAFVTGSAPPSVDHCVEPAEALGRQRSVGVTTAQQIPLASLARRQRRENVLPSPSCLPLAFSSRVKKLGNSARNQKSPKPSIDSRLRVSCRYG